MRITIHRANQIGGCITVIEHDGCKIIIDLGCNLPGSQQKEYTKDDIAEITKGTNAIFYTHYHGDHTGLHHLVDANIPQYIGEGAKEVMLCKYNVLGIHSDFSKQEASALNMKTYKENTPIQYDGCDKIKVTPYFVSHSAFDAYMFKIECAGLKILHTGDFRKHGYLGKGLIPTLKKLVGQVDLLITEGTMLGRRQEVVLTEGQIKRNVYKALDNKYVFALCSSTDIDRLASFNAACREKGRVFLVDHYQKAVLDIFTKYKSRYSCLFDFSKAFDKPSEINNVKIINYLKDKGFLMPIRSSSLEEIKKMKSVFNDKESWLIYSMWSGYAEEGKEYTNPDIISIRKEFGQNIFDGTRDGFHTSGHADIATLEEVCTLVNPKIGVIPIHKDVSTSYNMEKIRNYKIFNQSEKVSDWLDIIID